MQPYADQFVPKFSTECFPVPIPELYNPAMLHVNYIGLLEECEKVLDSIMVSIHVLHLKYQVGFITIHACNNISTIHVV